MSAIHEPPEDAHDAGGGHRWVFVTMTVRDELDIPPILAATRHPDPDVDGKELVTAGIIDFHRRPDTGEWCGGSVPFLQWAGRPMWTVNSLDPLDLDPSLLCAPEKGGCGDHGHYRAGRWVPA